MRRVIFGIVLVSLFIGCATPDRSVSNVYRNSDNRYIVNSIPLSNKIAIVDYKSKFEGGLLLAMVDVRNIEPKSYDLEYRFSWRDSDGFEVGKTPWLPLTINGKEVRSVQRIATNPRAKTFKFYIRLKQ